jgi:hypothetical protein
MSDLVVIVYPAEAKAEEMRTKLASLQKEYLLELGDAVIAVKQEDGNAECVFDTQNSINRAQATRNASKSDRNIRRRPAALNAFNFLSDISSYKLVLPMPVAA